MFVCYRDRHRNAGLGRPGAPGVRNLPPSAPGLLTPRLVSGSKRVIVEAQTFPNLFVGNPD